jgi:hypothetical protein
LLAHMTGQSAPKPCKNCHKGHGPWTQCVVYDGQMCGSCTNCWFNASGSRCTFHGKLHFFPTLPARPLVSVSSLASSSDSICSCFESDEVMKFLSLY